jgi:hypothetical protein
MNSLQTKPAEVICKHTFWATWPNPTLLSSMHVKHRVTGLNARMVALAQDQPHVALLHTLPVHQPRPRRTHLRELALQRLAEPDVVVLCSAGLDVRAVVLLRCRRHREHRGLFPIARHELEGALASDPVSCFSFRFFTGGWGPS